MHINIYYVYCIILYYIIVYNIISRERQLDPRVRRRQGEGGRGGPARPLLLGLVLEHGHGQADGAHLARRGALRLRREFGPLRAKASEA